MKVVIKKIFFVCLLAGAILFAFSYSYVHFTLNKEIKYSSSAMDKPANESIYYFAYGSNMWSKYLTNIRSVKTYGSTYAHLEDYQVKFNLYGINHIEPAFANLVPLINATAHGVLHKIDQSSISRIANSESKQYVFTEVEVLTAQGDKVKAYTLVGKDFGESRAPSRRYLNILIAGAKEHELPEKHIDNLETTRSAYIPILSELVGTLIYLMVILKSH